MPNLQNNYYYNFNNTYVPQNPTGQAGMVEVSSRSNHTTSSGANPPKEVKSIEIQVSPERLLLLDNQDVSAE